MALRSPVQAIAKPATRDLEPIRSKTEYQIGQEGVEPRSKAELEAPKGPEPFTQKPERLPSQDDNDLSASRDPDSHHDSVGSRTPADPPRRRHGVASGGSTPRRTARQNAGSSSVEQSPLHPHQLARIGGRSNGVPSPSQERKFSLDGHGSAPSTPWRNRPRSATRGDETPERCAAVPKFGDWDETNAASADGYSLIFSKVREEKQSGGMPTELPHPNVQKQYDTKDISKGCFCFRWGRK